MSSFEDLGLSAPLVEALAAEGMEVPTRLQEQALPVLRRSNSAVLRTGPGAGSLVAYGAALLDQYEPDGAHPRALVLTTSRTQARDLAMSLARLSLATGHRVGALGVAWALPERSDLIFSTPEDLERAIRSAQLKLDQVGTLVFEGAARLLEGDSGERITAILQGLDAKALQIIAVGDPLTPAVRRFVDGHMKRAVYFPPEAMEKADVEEKGGVDRGTIRIRTVPAEEEEATAVLVAELLEGGDHQHVLIFVHSEDRAADLGDFLTLRGFLAGAPGDLDVPVWLGVEGLAGRDVIRAHAQGSTAIATVSVDVPADADELDRRHGATAATGRVIVAHPRELPHLRRVATEGGYTLTPDPDTPQSGADEADRFRTWIEGALEEEDLVPYLLLLEPLFRDRDAAEVAAALAALLRRKTPVNQPLGTDGHSTSPGARPQAWVRLFMSVGSKDGIGPGDLLGAIIGESGVQGEQVGKIDLRETYAKVEVQEEAADRILRTLNGTTIRGRSVRVDFDRGEGRPSSSPPQRRPPRKGPGRPSGPSGGRSG